MAVTTGSEPLSTVMTTTLSNIVSNTSNSSGVVEEGDDDQAWGLVAMVTTSCILGVVILTTVIGEYIAYIVYVVTYNTYLHSAWIVKENINHHRYYSLHRLTMVFRYVQNRASQTYFTQANTIYEYVYWDKNSHSIQNTCISTRIETLSGCYGELYAGAYAGILNGGWVLEEMTHLYHGNLNWDSHLVGHVEKPWNLNPRLTGVSAERHWPGGGGGAYNAPPRLTPKPMTAARRARRRWKGLGETVLKHS